MSKTMSQQMWRAQWDFCWLCRYREGWSKADHSYIALQLHHLVGNSMRAKADTIPASWFCACSLCHPQFSSQPTSEELAKRLAAKRHFDPENYDRIAVNRLLSPYRRGGWEDGPVTEAEVDEAARILFGGEQ